MRKAYLVAIVFLFGSIRLMAADYYWVGNSGSWSDVNHWATSSGGTTKHTTPPSANDDVYFDANSFIIAGQIVTITSGARCRSMNWTGAMNGSKIYSFFEHLDVYGSLILPSSIEREFFGDVRFKATSGSHVIDLGGLPLSQPNHETLSFEGVGGTWTLQSDIIIERVDILGGTLITNGYNIETSTIFSNGLNARGVQLGNSDISCSVWNLQSTSNFSLTPGTSTISVSIAFHGGGITYHNLVISGNVEVTGSNTFNALILEPNSVLELQDGSVQTIENMISNADLANPATIKSATEGVVATFFKSSGSVSVNNVRIRDNHATGGSTFSAPLGSVDLGNVSGWNISTVEPTIQVTSLQLTRVVGNEVSLRWTNGNGAKRIILARQGGSVNANPTDLTDYSAGPFGVGSQIGSGNYVVYVGNGDRAAITGLTNATSYHFRVYEFSGSGSGTNYFLTSAPTISTSTLPTSALVMSNEPATVCSGKFYDSGGDDLYYYDKSESFVKTISPATPGNKIRLSFVEFYTAADDILTIYDGENTSAPILGSFSEDNAPDIITATNAAGKLTIQFTSNSFLESTGWNANISCVTLDTEPSVASSAILFTNITGQSMRINWTNGNGARRLVIARRASAVSFVPVDGNDYSANAAFGSGTLLGASNYVVYNGTGNFVDVTNLSQSTTYHFSIFEYNGANTSANYRSVGTVANRTTANTEVEPTVPSSDLVVVSRTTNSINIQATKGNGSNALVLIKEGSPVDFVPEDGIAYTANRNYALAQDVGNGNKVVSHNAAFGLNISGLDPSRIYHFAIFEYNGFNPGTTNYLTTGVPRISTNTFALSPDRPGTIAVEYTANEAVFNWTRSTVAENYLVALWPQPAGSTTYTYPKIENGVQYTGDSFFGNGSAVNPPGSFVVYTGDDTTVHVTNLKSNTEYYYILYAYNGNGIYTSYSTARTGSFSTPKHKPNIQVSALSVSQPVADSARLTWQNGDGEYALVIIRHAQPINHNLKDTLDFSYYSSNQGNYEQGVALDDAHLVVYKGSSNSVTIKNLAPGEEYYVAVYAFNTVGGVNYFRTVDAPMASFVAPAGKDYYWVGGTGRWSQSQIHWATTSGGSTFHNSAPTASDNVYFDENSFLTDQDSVLLDIQGYCLNMDLTKINKQVSFIGVDEFGLPKCSQGLSIYGSVKLSPNISHLRISDFYFRASTANHVIDLAGVELEGINGCGPTMNFRGFGGEWTFVPGAYDIQQLSVSRGTIISENATWRMGNFYMDSFGGGEMECIMNNSTISTRSLRMSKSASIQGGSFLLEDTRPSVESYAHFKKLTIQGELPTLSGGFSADTLEFRQASRIRIQSGSTFEVNHLLIPSDTSRMVLIESTVPGLAASFRKKQGEIRLGHVKIRDNTAVGGAQFYADNSINGGNVTGWSFTEPPLFTPSIIASDPVFNRVHKTELHLSWKSGNGQRRIVVVRVGSPVMWTPDNDLIYTPNNDLRAASDVGEGHFIVYNGIGDSLALTGLTPGANYHFAIFEYNQLNNQTKYKQTQWLKTSVEMLRENDIIVGNEAITTCDARYYDDGGKGFYTKGRTYTQTFTPASAGKKMALWFRQFNLPFQDSLVIYDGSSTSAPILATSGYYDESRIFAATNPTGQLTIRFKSSENSQGSFSGWDAELFCVGALANEPTVQPSGVTITKVENSTDLELAFTKGNGTGRLIMARENASVFSKPVDGFLPLVNGDYARGLEIAEGNYIVYAGAEDRVRLTGFRPGTLYHFAIFEYNGTSGTANYKTDNPLIASETTNVIAPSIPSSKLIFSNISKTSLRLEVVPGNGGARLVVMRKWKPVGFRPQDNTNYDANTSFGLGSSRGDSTYVIARLSGSYHTTIQNLEPGTRYYIKVFEYNSGNSSNSYKYLVDLAPEQSVRTLGPALRLLPLQSFYCPGGAVQASFISSGDFNLTNRFKLQLSDSLGSFANPITLEDTVIMTANGQINAKLPANISGGSNYQMRILTTSPIVATDSLHNIEIPHIPNVSIKVNGSVFESSSVTSNQWYRNGVVIEGATATTIAPVDDGAYHVRVTEGACYKESQPVIFTGLAFDEFPVMVAPNPFKNEFVIINNSGVATSYLLIDAVGREYKKGVLSGGETKINAEHMPAGVVFIKIFGGQGARVIRMIKQ